MELQGEIEAVHDFLQAWLGGDPTLDEAAWRNFENVIGPKFTIISPNGEATERVPLMMQIKAARGARGLNFRIWTKNHNLHYADDRVCVGTYEEWQSDDDEPTARRSTVVFARASGLPRGLVWMHLHETWMTTDS